MPTVAIIVAHPNLSQSTTNRALIEGVATLDNVIIHDLYAHYPDFKIDVEAEHQLMRKADTFILQFPLYWYSSPALLKEWLDKTFTLGFAYGEGADGVKGKNLLVATSADAPESLYANATTEDGQMNAFYLPYVLSPFQALAGYAQMTYCAPFAIYSASQLTKEARDARVAEYRALVNRYVNPEN